MCGTRWIVVAMVSAALISACQAADEPAKTKPERLGLWNQRAPNGDGTFEAAEAWITVHRPEKPNGQVWVEEKVLRHLSAGWSHCFAA